MTQRTLSLTQPATTDVAELAATLRVDQWQRWRLGERVSAESYLDKFPHLREADDLAVDLVYSEFLVREELGDAPTADEYIRRFPQFAEQLRRQFELHAELAVPDESTGDAAGDSDDAGRARTPISPRGLAAPVHGPVAPASIGRFEIKQQLGAGGFGSVFRAYDPQLGRDVALKVPHAHLLTGEHHDRFLREARAAAQLQHPNLVAVYDSGVAPQGCYIAYQLVPGQSLAQALKERTFAPPETAALVRKLAEAAEYAHSKGVFHRDLKTANVLLDERGEPFISDFGLVRCEGDATLTADATVLGTPAYMPPEQALGASHQADARSDVYTLGVVLYELLTGRLPFDGPPQGVLRQVVEQDPPPLRTLNDRVPRELETICLKALAKRPVDRYATAQDLADDLGRWLRDEPILARPIRVWARAIKWARRHPAAAALIGVIAAAILALSAVGTGYNLRLRAANVESKRLLAQTRLLLSQAQAERGVQLLENDDVLGLLHLLEARRTAQELPLVRVSRALLWAGWYDACAERLAQVLGNESEAEVLAFSPDGSLLATGSAQGARLWEVATGRPRSEVLPHQRRVPVAFSAHGKLFVTVTPDAGLRVWDTVNGQPHETNFGTLKNVRSLAASPNGRLLAVGAGRDVWLGDLSTGEFVDRPLKHDSDVGVALAFSPGATGILVTTSRAGEQGVARLWRIDSAALRAQPIGRPLSHEDEIVAVAFSPDGSRVATASLDDTARLWDTTTGAAIGQPMRHQDDVWAIAFSPDGRTLATASFDGTARLWDATNSRPISAALSHRGPVRSLDFSPDPAAPGLLATGSFDGTIRLWNAATAKLIPAAPLLRHPGNVTNVRFSPDGHLLASTSATGSARIWNVTAHHSEEPRSFPHDGRVYSVALSPHDARILATGSSDGTARLWDTATGGLLAGPWREPGEVMSVAISQDSRLLAIGVDSPSRGTVELRDATTGELVGSPIKTHAPISVLAFSPNSKLLATGTIAGTVQVWDLATGQPHGPILRHRVASNDQEITALAFSPESTVLATASDDKTVQLWDVGTGKHRGQFLWHDGHVSAVAFSPDGKRLASAASDLSVRFWDAATGQSLPQTIRPSVSVQALAFSPSGRLLATASVDGSARLWDLETGLACGLPFKHDALASSLAFSDDERWLATGSFDKTARLWRLPQILAETDVGRMQLRTWVALGARLGPEGNIETIPWQEWQSLRRELLGPNSD